MKKRNIYNKIKSALQDTPVILINGARQTGKSTLVKTLVEKTYFTLDNMTTQAAIQADPSGFIASQSNDLIIDEVQRLPELFLAIKQSVDENRQPGRFILTGSANVLLLPKLADSLAGRMEILTLWPLSQGELMNRTETFLENIFSTDWEPSYDNKIQTSLSSQLIRGGYPEAFERESQDRRDAWFEAYITTILQRDIRDIANIEGLSVLPRLLSLLASRVTGMLNYAELARTSQLPQTTLKRYMTILQTIFLVHLLPSWSHHRGKRLVKSPKIMLNDTGLLCYLLGLDETYLESKAPFTGPVLENFVVCELLKQLSWSSKRIAAFHFRTQTGHEVDIVLEDKQSNIVGIEVKSKAALKKSDLIGLNELKECANKKMIRGIILYGGTEIIQMQPGITAIPLNSLWQ